MIMLNACQTHFPIVSESVVNETMPCDNTIEPKKTAYIDYLLYANRMVDRMITDKKVQEKLNNKRLKLVIASVKNNSEIGQADINSVNSAVINRLKRSGQFIIVNNLQNSDVQFSGAFAIVEKKQNSCIAIYEQFSLHLTDSQTKQVIWSDKKLLK